MKITFDEKKKDEEIKFPCLMQCENGYIVLMWKDSCGTVIKSDNYKIGSYHQDWAMKVFKPFNGTITLEN